MPVLSNKFFVRAGLMLLLAAALAGCRTAPVTGRRQLMMLPEDREVSMGLSAYQEVTTKQPLSTNQQYVEMVNRVGQRIAAVAGRPDYQWEFHVIADAQQNAFCLPGGKVAVYEGILPICQNEAGLAVVMSHEIAHALARHGGERISQGYAVEAVRQVAAWATQSREQQQRDMVMKAYGAASQYGFILPYSRKHESEADHIGLMLMAKAGYDPQEAPRFWQRFAASHQGTQPSEFMSTHPNDEHRAQALELLLADAMKMYTATPNKIGLGEMIAAAPSTTPQPGGASFSTAQTPNAAAPAAAGSNIPAFGGWAPKSGGAATPSLISAPQLPAR